MANRSTTARRGRTLLTPMLVSLAMIAGTTGAVMADGAIQGVTVRAEQGVSELTFNGRIFHSTSRAVSNLRTIAVPGTAQVLILWNELAVDGTSIPHYAVSLDGQTIAGRVRETSYAVQMRYGSFDPMAQAEPAVEAGLRATKNNELYLVQFWVPPLESFREQVTAAGGQVERFMTNHTFVVRMNAATKALVSAMPQVRWVGAHHPAYRMDDKARAFAMGQLGNDPLRWSIECAERGERAQTQLRNLIESRGGTVHFTQFDGHRFEATMTPQTMLAVMRTSEVNFIDAWEGFGGPDMVNGRLLMGSTFLQTSPLNFSGQGVRGEIFDTENCTTHVEWRNAPVVHSVGTTGSAHGTSCYGINFAQGIQASAKGHMPDGQGIFFLYTESSTFGGTKSRLQIAQELANPNGPYRAVFQTSSVGSPQVSQYTTLSAEMDDVLFQTHVLHCQSQSNTGNTNSRPQAWAKNIMSGGAVQHNNSPNRASHTVSGASIGPATDGRVKPTLAGFYDAIDTTSTCGYTTGFGGTSGGTPMVCGTFGLFFQMWHEGVFSGFGGGGSVFESRANYTTARAMMIASAYRYPISQLARPRQGWGMPDLQKVYNMRDKALIIDEADVITPMGSVSYDIDVLPGEPELLITMVYEDPQGNPSAQRHRINDLSLKVTSPTGTVYWGNNGLVNANYNTSGGTSNLVDVEENVFVQNPTPGSWTIEVYGDEIVQDAHLETPGIDADFGLVALGGLGRTGIAVRLPGGAPTQVAPNAPTNFDVLILPGGDQIVPGSPTLHYRLTGGAFQTAPLVNVGGDNWRASLPGGACTADPEFYVSAAGVNSGLRTSPPNAPANFYSAIVGQLETGSPINESFETGLPTGWTVSGLWTTTGSCAPSGTPCQGTRWLYYGNTSVCNYSTPGQANSGSAISPVINLPELPYEGSITLKYCTAKQTENAGLSFDKAEVFFNGVRIDQVPEISGWTERTINLSSFAGQSGRLEFRFDTVDSSRNAFRGWHVDNVRLSFERRACDGGCYADCDTSTGGGVLDIFDFLCFQNKFAATDPYACECDVSTGTGVCDIFDFLCFQNAFAAGCP